MTKYRILFNEEPLLFALTWTLWLLLLLPCFEIFSISDLWSSSKVAIKLLSDDFRVQLRAGDAMNSSKNSFDSWWSSFLDVDVIICFIRMVSMPSTSTPAKENSRESFESRSIFGNVESFVRRSSKLLTDIGIFLDFETLRNFLTFALSVRSSSRLWGERQLLSVWNWRLKCCLRSLSFEIKIEVIAKTNSVPNFWINSNVGLPAIV